jgi:hypothetical protein
MCRVNRQPAGLRTGAIAEGRDISVCRARIRCAGAKQETPFGDTAPGRSPRSLFPGKRGPVSRPGPVEAARELGADVDQGRCAALRARPASRPHGSWAPTWNRAGGRDAGSWQLKGMAGETHEYSRTPQSSEKKSFPLCKPSAAAAAKSCYDRSCGVGFWGSFRPGLVPLVFLGKYSPLSPEKPCSSTSSSAPAKPGIWAGW